MKGKVGENPTEKEKRTTCGDCGWFRKRPTQEDRGVCFCYRQGWGEDDYGGTVFFVFEADRIACDFYVERGREGEVCQSCPCHEPGFAWLGETLNCDPRRRLVYAIPEDPKPIRKRVEEDPMPHFNDARVEWKKVEILREENQ